jgi:hypothetical protein
MTPSPVVLSTSPPPSTMAEASIESCRSSAEAISSGCSSQSSVLASMSVKRKVWST